MLFRSDDIFGIYLQIDLHIVLESTALTVEIFGKFYTTVLVILTLNLVNEFLNDSELT